MLNTELPANMERGDRRRQRLLIYVASPYGLEPALQLERQTAAEAFGREAIAAGCEDAILYMPIAMHVGWASPELGVPLTRWPPLEEAWMSRCDALWVLTMDGWRESPGVAREMSLAREHRLPILQVDPAAMRQEIRALIANTRTRVLRARRTNDTSAGAVAHAREG